MLFHMASLQQKRPSISNWFSSLRRQPKNKKSPVVTSNSNSFYGGTQKQYQRSCIDLSTTQNNSSFYVPKQNQQYPYEDNTLNSSAQSRIGSTDTILQDSSNDGDDDHSVIKPVSKLCSRCCCAISRPTTPSPKLSPKKYLPKSSLSPSAPRSPSLTPLNTVAKYIHLTPSTPPPASPATPISPTLPVTLSSETVITTDVSNDLTVTRLPCASECETVNLNRRGEFKRSMITTTTRTLVVSRPLELVLNEHGEIISRRPSHLETIKARSNSLDCVLDSGVISDEECNISSSNSYSPCSPTPTASPASALISGESGEFRFIDDSSTSQSEADRNSQQSATNHQIGRRLNENEPQMLRTTKRSYNTNHPNNNSNNNYQNNNNNYNNGDESKNPVHLCATCKKVIEKNRANTAQSAGFILSKQQIKDELSEVLSEMEALDVPEDCKHSNKEKQMSIGRKKFNMDPKKGIEYLQENRLLRHDSKDVAHFLYKGEGLNKTAIGDYLGEKNDFNEDVLKSFVELHDFTNLILVQALRQFLWSFRLPGEAQKIDRMMECFAQRYCQLNPDIFTNTDTCYVLSFAIIMLNTSLHNPSVKDKPTVEQFISMNRGINNGGDLPRELLESLYESIRTEPFKIPQDDGNDLMHTFFNPDKEGWLWKQGGRYKSWKRRWFILNDNCLYYFEYTTDKEPRGIIPLENISVREIHDRSKPHCFELFATGGADIIKACKTDSEGKVVEGKHTVYRMSASTEEDQQEWIKRLTQSISHNPFYDILVQRKKKALSKS